MLKIGAAGVQLWVYIYSRWLRVQSTCGVFNFMYRAACQDGLLGCKVVRVNFIIICTVVPVYLVRLPTRKLWHMCVGCCSHVK